MRATTHDEAIQAGITQTREDDKTMRAIVQQRYGSSDTLRLDATVRPSVAADEVLIEVHAAGVDRGVWHLMTGMPYLVRLMGYGLRRPAQPVPGADVAGRVVATGRDVERFKVGDEVFGIADGSFAEFAAAKEHKLARKPASLTFEGAAVASISGITALQALTDIGRIEAGQEVLVLGASGGVGSYAVQLAKALGGKVTGVASTSKLEFVRSLGADDVIDYTSSDALDGSRRYDLIIDAGGRNPLRRLRAALTPSGTLVIVGGEGGDRLTGGMARQIAALMWSPFVSQRLTMFISTEDHRFIDRLAGFIERGEVTPAVGARYELEEAPAAIADLAAGRAEGKSVIVVR
jgi:NADPH:quinone reductase-like Zn-dependent oxidoreductase